ncbi:MAG: hypothetical protein AAFZ07_11025 [Actinomycetota bacterium]
MAVDPDDGQTSNEAPAEPDAQPSRRRRALDEMVKIADESGMYERTATPKRTR